MNADPASPIAWANFLVRAWGPRFPVDLRAIALEYSKRFDDPVAKIAEAAVDTFEGAIYYRPKRDCWFILYNPTIVSPGRINFTLGHEFGHYLNHRRLIRENSGFLECSQGAVLGIGDDAARQVEQEADTFASYLLMPMDDFRRQVEGQAMTLDLLTHCANRYGVSLTAAARKWIEFTEERAVLVIGRDDFVLWARSSERAYKSGVYFKSGTPLPPGSLALRADLVDAATGLELAAGVWRRNEPVREMTIFADRYDLTISLLLLPKEPPLRFPMGFDHEEPTPDTFELLTGR